MNNTRTQKKILAILNELLIAVENDLYNYLNQLNNQSVFIDANDEPPQAQQNNSEKLFALTLIIFDNLNLNKNEILNIINVHEFSPTFYCEVNNLIQTKIKFWLILIKFESKLPISMQCNVYKILLIHLFKIWQTDDSPQLDGVMVAANHTIKLWQDQAQGGLQQLSDFFVQLITKIGIKI